MSMISASVRQSWNPQTSFGSHIDLADNTRSQPDLPDDDQVVVDGNTSPKSSSHKLGRVNTLRSELARRKYAKYGEDRYKYLDDETLEPITRKSTVRFRPEEAEEDLVTSGVIAGESRSGSGGKIRSGQRRVRNYFGHRRRVEKQKEADTVIDILYENQRGSFFFGMPLYSSQSLLNFDPPAWTTAQGKRSAVDVTNAQLPDPNWEWAWKSWYVDMSGDVDEQGWQYSFMFQHRFPWHGTHPFLHSFVRRRRWIRKRFKRHHHLPNVDAQGDEAMKEAHKLTPDYFTIHSFKAKSPRSSYANSGFTASSTNISSRFDTATDPTDIGLDNISSLLQRLKAATIDREKINSVLRYMDEGGDDVHYLADEMPHILSFFLFQHSRRHLLTGVIKKLDALERGELPDTFTAERRRSQQPKDSVESVESEETQESKSTITPQEDDDVKEARLARRIKDFRRAADAADEAIRRLEYWSDIREVVQMGDTAHGVSEDHGWGDGWQGLDSSGAVTSRAKEKARAL